LDALIGLPLVGALRFHVRDAWIARDLQDVVEANRPEVDHRRISCRVSNGSLLSKPVQIVLGRDVIQRDRDVGHGVRAQRLQRIVDEVAIRIHRPIEVLRPPFLRHDHLRPDLTGTRKLRLRKTRDPEWLLCLRHPGDDKSRE
jgi:hypothetical protein